MALPEQWVAPSLSDNKPVQKLGRLRFTLSCRRPPSALSNTSLLPALPVMSSSRSEFVELFNLLVADDRRRSVPGDLSPFLSRLNRNSVSSPFTSNVHRRAKSEAISGNGEFLPVDSQFPFTFKKMIHTLYDAQTWADKVNDLLEESKSQFKPLPEELKSRESSGEGGFQIRTIKKRCTGRTHVPDPVFVPKPTYVSHHARTTAVDLHIEGHKVNATSPSPTKRRPSQTRTTRPAPTLPNGVRRPRHKSLTQLDLSSPLLSGLAPLSDSDDSEFDVLVTPTDTNPISTLPPLKIPKRSNTTLALPNQPSILKGRRQTGRVRSSSFGGPTSAFVSPVLKTFEPDGE